MIPDRQQWALPTATSWYVVSLAPEGMGLVLDGWGPDPQPPPWLPPERLQFETAADLQPLEFAALGTRQVNGSELVVDFGDGAVGARPEGPHEVELTEHGTRTRLTARFREGSGRVGWTTVIETDRSHDVVRKWVQVANTGAGPVRLSRAFSGAWALPVGPGARVEYLAGRWSREFTPYTLALSAGEFSIGSRTGTTSHGYAPTVTVSALGGHGPAYGVALAWSGSWRLLVDAVPFQDRIRISGGVDDESTVITLEPGQRFSSPELHGVCAPEGVDGVADRWHDFQRSTLARTLNLAHRPIVYNSWYATEFDVELAHQTELAEVAAELGTEVFVVDDGWFRGRNSDRAGLGDWTPDPVKFPGGLDPLITAVQDRGMRFGIWVEPEAVNADSDLYRTHPDWIYRSPDREPITVRNQYVLDFGRPEVVAWANGMLRDLLADHRISYLKWDMNRPITDGGRRGDEHGREWSIQHVRGYYAVMRTLRAEFPHVTVEACSGGGGRVDHAVLGLSDVVWPSDETGPRDRLAIQHGFLSAYPPSVMSSWVTDAPDLLDREVTSFEFRFVVAMAGVLGIGSDVLAWDVSQRKRAAELVGLYRELRELIQQGRVVRHGSPSDSVYAVEYGGGPAQGGRTCLLVYGRADRPDQVRVRPHTLDPDLRYRLRGHSDVLTGSEAARGVEIPFALATDTDVLVFEPVGVSPVWRPVPVTVVTDPEHGGRWTSLRAGAREWLWTNPDSTTAAARHTVRPGDGFVDAGGVEECLPTIRGVPDHGDVWSRPWELDAQSASVPVALARGGPLGTGRLRRRLTQRDPGLAVSYTLNGPPGAAFLHAVHALLDVGPEARLLAHGEYDAVVLNTPGPGEQSTIGWPGGLDRLGPDDGTAHCVLLRGCRAADVVDGQHRLSFRWSAADPAPCSLMLWRNLRGWPERQPYRSIGIEPMVGRAADQATAGPGEQAVLTSRGTFRWSLTVTAFEEQT